jgi:hypothetical protein
MADYWGGRFGRELVNDLNSPAYLNGVFLLLTSPKQVGPRPGQLINSINLSTTPFPSKSSFRVR